MEPRYVQAVFPICAWCKEPCNVPDNQRVCGKDECEHDDGEAVYCSRSCSVADHG